MKTTKKTLLVLLALLLSVSMLLCACDDGIPELSTGESEETTTEEANEPSNKDKKPSEQPGDEENNGTNNSGSSTPIKGEALAVDMYRLAYSDLGLAYTGYSEDDRIAMQVFYDVQMNYEKNLYCEYRYDELKRLVWFGAYGLENGYGKYEMYHAEITYDGNGTTPASVKYYENGVLAEDGAKLEYHPGGMISLIWLGADDDCELFFSFDEKGRLLCCSYDQEWATYVLKYGVKYADNEYPEQVEIHSSMDGSVDAVADLTYNEQGFLLEMLLTHSEGGSKLEFEYQDNWILLTKYTISMFGADGTVTMKNVSEAVLDAEDRVIQRTQKMYQGDELDGKTVESFEYDESSRVIHKELKRYLGDADFQYRFAYSWEYDAAGRVIKQERIDYDSNDRQTAKEIKDYEYNAMGKMTLERTTRYDANNAVKDTFGYRYTYDEQGNKIETKPLGESSDSANANRG